MKDLGQRKGKKIPFHIHPYEFEKGNFAFEKSDSEGIKRRYLKGITSGLKFDGHEERVTKACIDKMQAIAKSGDVLLYDGPHGVTPTDDIGILVDSEVTPTGEWITTYRLYDEYDDQGAMTIERANKQWKRSIGQFPYKRPMQQGFSIEGWIPEGGIVQMDEMGGHRVIDDIELDGVIVTKRPAYKDSVLTAVYKALGEITPEHKNNLAAKARNEFSFDIEGEIAKEQKSQDFYTKKYKMEDILNTRIDKIMSIRDRVEPRLNVLFDEYKKSMINLIVKNADMYEAPQHTGQTDPGNGVAKARRLQMFRNIEGMLLGLKEIKTEQFNKSRSTKNGTRNNRSSKRINPRRKTNTRKHTNTSTTA